MELTVRLFAVLRERAGREAVTLAGLPEGLTVGDLKRRVESSYPELGDLSHVAGVVGTDYATDDRVLHPGDEVSLLPPVSGGCGPDYAAGVFELCSGALDVASLQERVVAPHCGAVVTFTGVTRDRNREKDVVQLDYEAFEAMAEPEMSRIFADCVERHGDGAERRLRMLCVHRLGTVSVGEPSVVISVASPHRDAAFEAARFLIDTLKERLPVWKKEVYGDGHHWIGDRS